MIVPMKESVEILDIQYPVSEYNEGEVVDMEMDSDGNIMCMLKDLDGKCGALSQSTLCHKAMIKLILKKLIRLEMDFDETPCVYKWT